MRGESAKPGKPIASLSLDLDNKWSYLRTHGNPEWEDFPTYLPAVVPRIVDTLGELGIRITFFVVGRDASDPRHDVAFRRIAEAGHEVASHSFMHETWLHLLSREELVRDFEQAERAIFAATGQHPAGFRGPGFSISSAHLAVLVERGYEYDATVFPNLLNPLARAYFFARSNLSEEERKQREGLFGTLGDAVRPIKPFDWDIDGQRLLEIPVSTMPLFRVPIHFSYVLYLAGFSAWLARLYFRFALAMAKVTGLAPSLLLHPLDFMGREDDADLSFFPGMNQPAARKLDVLRELLGMLDRGFEIHTMRSHADRLRQNSPLKVIEPKFSLDAAAD